MKAMTKAPWALAAAVAAVVAGSQFAVGAPLYYKGASGGSWSTAANWSTTPSNSGTSSAAPGPLDDAVFGTAALPSGISSLTVNVVTTSTAGTASSSQAMDVQFDGTYAGTTLIQGSGATTRNLNLGTNDTTVTASQTVLQVGSGSGAVTFGGGATGTNSALLVDLGYAPTTKATPYVFNNDSASLVTFQNPIVYNTATGASLDTLSLTGGGSGGFAFNDKISESNATRKIGLVVNLTTPSTVVRLSGASTYQNNTVITSGVVYADNTTGVTGTTGGTSSSSTGFGKVTLGSNGTLGGFGLVNGAVSGTGTISPGDPASNGGIGTLTLAGTGAGNTLANMTTVFEIAPTGTGADKINATGSLTLGGTLSFAPQSRTFAAGDTFDFLDGTFSGTFANAADGTAVAGLLTAAYNPGPGQRWDATNFYTDGTAQVVAAPEPATAGSLMLIGLGAMLGRVRRRASL